MNLNPIKQNMTELEFGGDIILFSYKTPVAALLNGLYYKTDKKWSNTTTRHINKWLGDSVGVPTRPQEFFDNLITEVK